MDDFKCLDLDKAVRADNDGEYPNDQYQDVDDQPHGSRLTGKEVPTLPLRQVEQVEQMSRWVRADVQPEQDTDNPIQRCAAGEGVEEQKQTTIPDPQQYRYPHSRNVVLDSWLLHSISTNA